MDQKVREEYVRIINAIWGDGIIHNNHPANINDEVVVIIEECLNYIREGSKGLLAINVALSIFYFPPSAYYEIINSFVISGLQGDIAGWIAIAKGDKIYKTTIYNAASTWRSPLQLALMGL